MRDYICLRRICEGEDIPEDVAGVQFTIGFKHLTTEVETWQDFLKWIMENPDILIALIQAILTLLGGISPPPKKAA